MRLPSALPSVLPAVILSFLAADPPAARGTAFADSVILRYAAPPVLVSTPAGREWRAAVDCAPPVSLPSLIGARVAFAYDFDLDGVVDAADTLGISPADCDEGASAPGRIALSRRLGSTRAAAVLRADLLTASDTLAARHVHMTGGSGSLLRIVRYCARPRNGEPEWIELRNVAAHPLVLAQARLEGRVLAGTLAPGEGMLAGGDTAELRLWQPGHRIIALSSWANLRNSGDTIRLTLALPGGVTGTSGASAAAPTSPAKAPVLTVMLDSLVYGPAADPSEGCASLAGEGSSAAASGYALEVSAPRWSRAAPRAAPSGSAPFVVTVHAPAGGRYDLFAYDLDGRPFCALARGAAGPATIPFPPVSCPVLSGVRADRVILHLAPRQAPGVRLLLRIGP